VARVPPGDGRQPEAVEDPRQGRQRIRSVAHVLAGDDGSPRDAEEAARAEARPAAEGARVRRAGQSRTGATEEAAGWAVQPTRDPDEKLGVKATGRSRGAARNSSTTS